MKKAAWITLLLTAAVLFAPGCIRTSRERQEAPVFITNSLTLQQGFVNVGVIRTRADPDHHPDEHAEEPLAIRTRRAAATVTLEGYTVHFDGPTAVTSSPRGLESAGRRHHSVRRRLDAVKFPGPTGSQSNSRPLDQLLPFNGGFDRETGKAEIDMAVGIHVLPVTRSPAIASRARRRTGPLVVPVLCCSGFRELHSIRGGSSCAGSLTSFWV